MIRFSLTTGRAWALSFALLLAQALGLHHGVAHGALGELHGGQHEEAQAPTELAASSGALHADHTAGDAQCRLVDQLGHTDFLWLACAAVPMVPTDRSGYSGAAPGTLPAAASAPYDARGPP